MVPQALRIRRFNTAVRSQAADHSIDFGIDTPEGRLHKAKWIRRIRNEFPLSQFGVTWGSKGERND